MRWEEGGGREEQRTFRNVAEMSDGRQVIARTWAVFGEVEYDDEDFMYS